MSSEIFKRNYQNELEKEDAFKERIFNISNIVVSFSSVIKKYITKDANYCSESISIKENEPEFKRILKIECAGLINECNK